MNGFVNFTSFAEANNLRAEDIIYEMNHGLGGSVGAYASEIMIDFEGYDEHADNEDLKMYIESEVEEYLHASNYEQDEFGEWCSNDEEDEMCV